MRKKNHKDPLKILGRSKGYSKSRVKEYLPRHKNFKPYLLRKIKEIPEVVLRNSGTPMTKKITRMMREISNEVYRAKQFTRTKINNRGVLFGTVLLEHRVLDLVLYHFHERWPQCLICLYNEASQKTRTIDENGKIQEFNLQLEEVVNMVSKKRPISPFFTKIQSSEKELFEILYKSQNIAERKNPRYFNQMIPKSCYKLPGMRKGVEKRFKNQNKKIDDFF
ncbi:MAG: DUF4130 domain-containing protein [Promethearchaeia archaeon]